MHSGYMFYFPCGQVVQGFPRVCNLFLPSFQVISPPYIQQNIVVLLQEHHTRRKKMRKALKCEPFYFNALLHVKECVTNTQQYFSCNIYAQHLCVPRCIFTNTFPSSLFVQIIYNYLQTVVLFFGLFCVLVCFVIDSGGSC